jgi:hypothetical protein
MPRYDYYCEANARTIEVVHPISEKVLTWGDICRIARISPGTTSPDSTVVKVFNTPPMANTPVGDSDLKNSGWTKLVKRSDGTYENVTRSGTEKRYLDPKDPSSMPHLHKKISD